MKLASNFILSLLILHWFYLVSQMFQPETESVHLLFTPDAKLPEPHDPYPFDFHWEWHPQNRSERFPSVQERVKLYMSNWYVPPCSRQDLLDYKIKNVDSWPRAFISGQNNTIELDSIIDADIKFMFQEEAIYDCARTVTEIEREGTLSTEERVKNRRNLQSYCSQVVGLVKYIKAMDDFTPKESRTITPIVGQFGDGCIAPSNPPIPVIAKWRGAVTRTELDKQLTNESCFDGPREPLNITRNVCKGMAPILWKLSVARHWDPIVFAQRQDVRWKDKTLGALWRGDFTGKHKTKESDLELCFDNQRCAFVFNNRDSKIIDAGLSSGLSWLKNGTISGVQVIKGRVTMHQIQQYKVIISFEGNDVASGLKWSLLSESVVLMPPPTRTSWAMEELLEPWVHYIPMQPDGSNAEEMVQWVGDHDEEAHMIAERGRLFMYDLLYHPDAPAEERAVKAEIARLYHALWQ